jgi:hypothetical protein
MHMVRSAHMSICVCVFWCSENAVSCELFIRLDFVTTCKLYCSVIYDRVKTLSELLLV